MPEYHVLGSGEPLPHFTLPSPSNPNYSIGVVAGRYLVLCFFHTTEAPASRLRLKAALDRPDLFDDTFASFFGILTDPEDKKGAKLANKPPGYRFLMDYEMTASRLCGAAPVNEDGREPRPIWVVTDPTLRVIDTIAFETDGSDIGKLFDCLASQPPAAEFAGRPLQAPILYLPRVFEPAFCERLIALYDQQGGAASGFMRQQGERTVGQSDPRHKVRRDLNLTDKPLLAELRTRILRRVVPEIAKVHQFHATRMERYLVACYDSGEGGHFAPHRDNTTSGTAHRRFAVSVNLNKDFKGGEVSFPEYGPQGFKAPAGGAVVFSCSLLHTVSRVTAGRRLAFLPFLYDAAAARIREANLHLLDLPAADDPPAAG